MARDIKIGSVEEFQGQVCLFPLAQRDFFPPLKSNINFTYFFFFFFFQERKVIIISTVRSSKDLVEFDLLHTLGFVASPRRFNGMIFFEIENQSFMI